MANERRRKPIGDDDELTRLIREAGQIVDASFARPSDESVRAYLLGNANAKQKHEVREALVASSKFRQEIAQLTEELEELPAGLFTETATPEGQASSFVKKQRTKSEVSFTDKISGWLGRILAPLSAPQWATAGAAAVIVVAISLTYLMRENDYIDVQPYLVSNSVEAEVLRGFKPRGADNTKSPGFPTSNEAALDAFRSVLEYQGGLFTAHRHDLGARTEGERRVSLQITDSDNQKSLFESIISAEAAADAANLELWILILPDRTLYRATLTSDAVGVRLESSPGKQFVVALTWQISDLHYSTIASSK